MKITNEIKQIAACAALLLASAAVHSQTEMDAIMMNKNQICNALIYNYGSWDKYWEGTLKRENLNLGRVSSQSVMYGANYGITDDLNVMVMAPYVWTKASAGTLTGMEGLQDISAFVKYRFVPMKKADQTLSLFALAGVSTPLSDYVVDFLPLSIGMGSTNVTGRIMADYEWKNITVTGSAAYIYRSNVTIDRSSYFDTQLRLTNEVDMPDAAQYQLRAGYRGKFLYAEALLTHFNTLGGFDITRNNMPFISNNMNSTTLGGSVKYTLPKHTSLALNLGGNYTLSGRNVGQSWGVSAGVLCAFYFSKKKTKTS